MIWKKVVGGTLKIKGIKIKPGDTVEMSEKDLRGFVKQFKLIEGTIETPRQEPRQEPKKEPEKPKQSFKVVHEGRGWYNVENEDGKVMNETKLRADDAEKLASDLNA